MEILAFPLVLLLLAAPVLAIVATVWAGRLDRRLRALEREVFSLGRQEPRPAPALEALRPSPPPPPPPERAAPPARPVTAGAPPPSEPGPPAGPQAAALEMLIGVRWFNVAGVVTLLFGIAFFLKYAYENAWIGPRGRVAIGVASGLAAVLVGEATRRRGHRIFSQGLTGGGVAAMYLSFFFSFRLYHLIEVAPAFGLMAAVTVCGVTLAVIQDSLAVAFLAFLGGYLTPVLLSTGQDAAGFLFSYLTVLALGALGATYFKRWRAQDMLALAGTCALYAAWHTAHYSRGRLGVAIGGLAVFFLIFLLVPYGHNLARRLVAGPADHLLALANAVFTFGYLYRMIHPISPKALGFVALALSAAYLGLGSLARRRLPEDRGLLLSILGLSVAFLTLAIPLQLGLHGITLAWATQGLVILLLGFRYGSFPARLTGLAVLALAVLRLFVVHAPLHTAPFTLLWNPAFGTWAFVVAAVSGAAWLYRRSREVLRPDEGALSSLCLVSAALLLLAALNIEIHQFFTLWSRPGDQRAGAVMMLWALFPLALLAAARVLEDRALRAAATGLMLPAVIPFMNVTSKVMAAPDPLFGSFAFWMGMLGVASFFAAAVWHHREGGMVLEDLPLHRLLAGAGTILLLLLLTAEVHSHFRLQPGSPERMAANGFRALLAVSVLWALFAAALMAIGFARSHRPSRYASFGLFGMTLLKVFFMDMAGLETIYRILSFMVVGLALLAASFVYSRFRSRIAALTLWIAVGALSAGDARAGFEPSGWRFVREIDATGTAGAMQPFAWFVLDEEVLREARPDLADLRVAGRDGSEVPHVVHARRGGKKEETYEPRLLNRVRLPGGAAAVELDFAGRVARNLLEVATRGDNFRRRVRVEGSEDGLSWAALAEKAWIYRIPASGSFRGARYDEVILPENDHRRLKVTVFPMAEEKEPIEITAVRARRQVVSEPEAAPLGATWTASYDPNARASTIQIDFGYRHARPISVDLDFQEDAFRRSYRLTGRNEQRMAGPRGHTERGDAVQVEVEAPWRPLGAGSLFRLPPGRAGEEAIDETGVALPGEAARYLKLVIDDQDNPPLRVRAVAARALVHRVVFPVRPVGAYRLYYGNPDAGPPHYDLPALLPDLEADPPGLAALGPHGANPLHGGRAPLPFTERHPWLLWIALVSAVAALALVALRNARTLSTR